MNEYLEMIYQFVGCVVLGVLFLTYGDKCLLVWGVVLFGLIILCFRIKVGRKHNKI